MSDHRGHPERKLVIILCFLAQVIKRNQIPVAFEVPFQEVPKVLVIHAFDLNKPVDILFSIPAIVLHTGYPVPDFGFQGIKIKLLSGSLVR